MNVTDIKSCLDLAIAKAAHDEAKELISAQNVAGDRLRAAQSIQQSLESLRRLQNGDMPDYDNWDPLMYTTWYQASQVNLAYSVLKWATTIPSSKGLFSSHAGNVQVVDFGCGALAMQFAVALIAADTLKSGTRLDMIKVDSFDSSRAMLKMGARVWVYFRAMLEEHHQGEPLSEIVNSMDIKLHRSVKSIEPVSDATRFLTAIHAVYDSNKKSVRKELRRLTRRLRPSGCFLTTYSGNWQLLNDVSPLRNAPRFVERTTGFPNPIRVQPQFVGNVERVFEWRRKLWSSLNLPIGAEGINYWLIRNMLNQPVS